MTNAEFERVYYPRYRDVIAAISRKFAKDDNDLLDDLVSAGTIGLLEALPERAGKNLDAFLRNIIRNKIVDHLRWLNRRDFERLDTYLRNGHDVVLDPVTQQPMFVHGDNHLLPTSGGEDASDAGHTLYANRLQRHSACHDFDNPVGDER